MQEEKPEFMGDSETLAGNAMAGVYSKNVMSIVFDNAARHPVAAFIGQHLVAQLNLDVVRQGLYVNWGLADTNLSEELFP